MLTIQQHDYVDLDTLAPLINAALPDVPQNVVHKYLHLALAQLASDTKLVERDYQLVVQPCVDEYEICFAQERVIAIVSYKQSTVSGCSLDINLDAPAKRVTVVGSPTRPAHAVTLNIRVATAPLPTACVVAQAYAEHELAITEFAKHLLFLMPDKPWTDPAAAAVSRRLYTDDVGDINAQGLLGYSMTPPKIVKRRMV